VLLREQSVGEGLKSRSNAPVADLRRDTGQSLVEFALILPLVLSILCGIVEFGRGFQSWLTITNAAAYGARTGAINPSSAGPTIPAKPPAPSGPPSPRSSHRGRRHN